MVECGGVKESEAVSQAPSDENSYPLYGMQLLQVGAEIDSWCNKINRERNIQF